jgi:redox-sensitive bicupin YhaK (pirin superfamily)
MDRFLTREHGRQTRHSFSFGSHYDAERVSFGPLVALNDHLLGARAGYGEHEHRDVVLVTWVVSGALVHEDVTGRVVQPAGQLAITRAGVGITHSEHADGGAVRFVQAWLRPSSSPDTGAPVRSTSTPDLRGDHLVVVAGPEELGVAGTTYLIADLTAGATVTVPPAPKRYLFVGTGALVRSSLAEPLHAGDAFEVTGEDDLTVTTGVPTQLLVWSFAE